MEHELFLWFAVANKECLTPIVSNKAVESENVGNTKYNRDFKLHVYGKQQIQVENLSN